MFLAAGEPAPWFTVAATKNPKYRFESVAGRYVLLCFLQSSRNQASQTVLEDLERHRHMFDDEFCCFFGVSIDPEEPQLSSLQDKIPGIRFLFDFDQAVSQQFGVCSQDGTYQLCTYILDERLRVLTVIPFHDQPQNHFAKLISVLSELPEIPAAQVASIQAPILVVPRIFEPEICQALIGYYNQHGGEESGFMREQEGRTVQINDSSFKRRRDQEILDESLRSAAMSRIHERLAPEIYKAFQFRATRIERHIVACYDGASRGFFRPHRDNTTKGTAHRRFAVSLNLNTGQYEGGVLRFPEFGRQTYTAPAGGAVVFSCSLLHEATPVTKGYRYVYLPFLYDNDAARIRETNRQFIGENPQKKGFQPKSITSRKSKKSKR